jgi:rhodanese-related sulfurtransferase
MNGPDSDHFEQVPQVRASEVHEHFQLGKVDILDVREPGEWELGHIEGATLMPLGQLPRRWREIDPSRKLVVVCLSGVRSEYAASLLRQVGIDAANLEGGMLAWQAERLPVTPPGIVAHH